MTTQDHNRIFAKNLNYQISKTGKMQKDIAKDLGISTTTLNNWCTAVASPKMSKVQMLADYFGIPKTALIDDLEEVELQGAEDALILAKFHKLNDANKQVIKATMDALIAAQANS